MWRWDAVKVRLCCRWDEVKMGMVKMRMVEVLLWVDVCNVCMVSIRRVDVCGCERV